MRSKYFGLVPLLTLLAAPLAAQAQQQSLDPYRAQTEVRLTRIENDVRKLTGNYEEAMYRLTQLNQKLEKQLEDMQFRIDQLEKKLAQAQSGAPAPQGAAAADEPPPSYDEDTTSGGPTQLPGMSADEGASSADEQAAGPDEQAASGQHRVPDTLSAQLSNPGGTPAPPRGTPEETPDQYLQGDTPEEQFQYAFSLLRRDDLEKAEGAFRAFLALHPDHKLAPNANYWLGKTYYARGNYAQAAQVLLNGYKQFADSDKGPDMILTLGLSLHELGQDEQACATYDELGRRYPNASPTIVQRAKAGQQAAGCQ
ncbi:MAG: tol-pal system protein YbgF [Alphaproteobacteria bacterium]|nr:tol-pal system protein YbgF [Alphaproteobacteria bacterium]